MAEAYHYRERGKVYYNKGDFEKAIDDFTDCYKTGCRCRVIITIVVLAYSRIGDFDKAVNDFHRGNKTKNLIMQKDYSTRGAALWVLKGRFG